MSNGLNGLDVHWGRFGDLFNLRTCRRGMGRGVLSLVLMGLTLAADMTLAEAVAFRAIEIDPSINGPISVEVADIDGDGDLDMVEAAERANDVIWWENADGDGRRWNEHVIDSDFIDARSAVASDVDGDLDQDVVVASFSGPVAWWENVDGDGVVWIERTISPNSSWSVAAADLDGDGDQDVIAGGSWWDNTNGDGTVWVENPVGIGAWALSALDMDGDGDSDVLGSKNRFSSLVSWWENLEGDGSQWSEHWVNVADPLYDVGGVHAEDLDGDGDLDLVHGSTFYGTYGDLFWHENISGDGTSWTEHYIDGYDTNDVSAADFDGDGDVDLVSGGAVETTWWENNEGDGSSWTEHQMRVDASLAVVAADVDGDGDPDVVGGLYYDDQVVWWENFGPSPALDVSGACPGDLTISAFGLTPLAPLALLGAASEGAFIVPAGSCSGAELGLAGPFLVELNNANVNGEAIFTVPVEESSCGLLLQAVDVPTCSPTGVAAIP